MSKKEKSKGVSNEKEKDPQTHAPIDLPSEGETQTTERKRSQKLP